MTQPIVYVVAQATRTTATRTAQALRRTTPVTGAGARPGLASNGRGFITESIAVSVVQARTSSIPRIAAARALGGTGVPRPTTGLLWPPGGWSRK